MRPEQHSNSFFYSLSILFSQISFLFRLKTVNPQRWDASFFSTCRLIYLLISTHSRTFNFHLFKSRDSLWILLNVVPLSLYSKEAIFLSDSTPAQVEKNPQALSLLATKALHEPGFVFFFLSERNGLKRERGKRKDLAWAEEYKDK